MPTPLVTSMIAPNVSFDSSGTSTFDLHVEPRRRRSRCRSSRPSCPFARRKVMRTWAAVRRARVGEQDEGVERRARARRGPPRAPHFVADARSSPKLLCASCHWWRRPASTCARSAMTGTSEVTVVETAGVGERGVLASRCSRSAGCWPRSSNGRVTVCPVSRQEGHRRRWPASGSGCRRARTCRRTGRSRPRRGTSSSPARDTPGRFVAALPERAPCRKYIARSAMIGVVGVDHDRERLVDELRDRARPRP